jgi:hypothetical protein
MAEKYNYIANKMMRRFTVGFRETKNSKIEVIDFEAGCVHKFPPDKIAKLMKIKSIKGMLERGQFVVSKEYISGYINQDPMFSRQCFKKMPEAYAPKSSINQQARGMGKIVEHNVGDGGSFNIGASPELSDKIVPGGKSIPHVDPDTGKVDILDSGEEVKV